MGEPRVLKGNNRMWSRPETTHKAVSPKYDIINIRYICILYISYGNPQKPWLFPWVFAAWFSSKVSVHPPCFKRVWQRSVSTQRCRLGLPRWMISNLNCGIIVSVVPACMEVRWKGWRRGDDMGKEVGMEICMYIHTIWRKAVGWLMIDDWWLMMIIIIIIVIIIIIIIIIIIHDDDDDWWLRIDDWWYLMLINDDWWWLMMIDWTINDDEHMMMNTWWQSLQVKIYIFSTEPPQYQWPSSMLSCWWHFRKHIEKIWSTPPSNTFTQQKPTSWNTSRHAQKQTQKPHSTPLPVKSTVTWRVFWLLGVSQSQRDRALRDLKSGRAHVSRC